MTTKSTSCLLACCCTVLIAGSAGSTVRADDAVTSDRQDQNTSSARSTGGESIETPYIRFSTSPLTGQYEVVDKQSKVKWYSNPFYQRLGEVTLNVAGQKQSFSLDRPEDPKSGIWLGINLSSPPQTAWPVGPSAGSALRQRQDFGIQLRYAP